MPPPSPGAAAPAPRQPANARRLEFRNKGQNPLQNGHRRTSRASAEPLPRNQNRWLRRQSAANSSPPSNSLLTGKLTRNFADSGPILRFLASIQPATSM